MKNIEKIADIQTALIQDIDLNSLSNQFYSFDFIVANKIDLTSGYFANDEIKEINDYIKQGGKYFLEVCAQNSMESGFDTLQAIDLAGLNSLIGLHFKGMTKPCKLIKSKLLKYPVYQFKDFVEIYSDFADLKEASVYESRGF